MANSKGGRPRKVINPRQVEALARIGCADVDIAEVCQCSVDTITRRFADNLRKGRESLHTRLRQKQIKVALAGNVTMLIWLGKQYLHQTDKQEHSIDPELFDVIIGKRAAENKNTNPGA